MTAATIANRELRFGDAASPEVFTVIPEIISMSGFGEVNELVEVTNLDSNGRKEYIAGNADGVEFDAECNHLDGNTTQEAVKSAAGTTRNFQYARTDSSPATVANFAAVCLGYEEVPGVNEQNRITFRFKITGAIT